MYYVAVHGDLEFLKYLKDNDPSWLYWGIDHGAAKGGHLEILEWLVEKGITIRSSTWDFAAKRGHLEILKWLDSKNIPLGHKVGEYVAQHGYWHILEWFKQTKPDLIPQFWGRYSFSHGVTSRSIETLEILKKEYCFSIEKPISIGGLIISKHSDSFAIRWAIELGEMKILQWLIENGFLVDPGFIILAAKHGYLEIMQYILKVEKPSPELVQDSYLAACVGKQLGTIKWLETEFPEISPNKHCWWQALRTGYLPVIKYLSKYPWEHLPDFILEELKTTHLAIFLMLTERAKK